MTDYQPDLDTRTLVGTVEAVRHYNAEDGWAVLRVRASEGSGAGDLCTAVGCLAEAKEGMDVRLWGDWAVHPVYGDQFKFHRYELNRPMTADAIKRSLYGGIIKGVGPGLAEMLVAHFGEDLLRVLDEEPDRLIEVPGIGRKKAQTIRDGWKEYRGSDSQQILMRLQGMDITSGTAIRILKQYGDEAVSIVERNPYQLALDVDGIGFKTADRIARSVGMPRSSPFRLQAGLRHALTEASGQGHCYLPRQQLMEYAGQLLECDDPDALDTACEKLVSHDWLVAEDMELPPSETRPEGMRTQAIYLPRLWRAEHGVAEHVRRIRRSEAHTTTTSSLQTWLQGDRRIGDAVLSEQQAEAVRLALTEKVLVLTGGPGVGKTTVTRAIVEIFEQAKCKVLLASPTGRASKRLAEVTGREAKTIHRLLEIDPAEWQFRRNLEHPLEADVVIVDEASMIDIDLMHSLVQAVPDPARLILVGDVDQLPSVGPGLVLRDLIDSEAIPVARLTEIFRQDRESQIVMNAYRVNAGQQPVFTPRPLPSEDCIHLECSDPLHVVEQIIRVVGKELPAQGFDPQDIQVLTPMNKRALGTLHLNAVLQEALNPSEPGKHEVRRGEKILREDDRVVQNVNNYTKDVFNGDIGTILRIETAIQKVTVQFTETLVTYGLDELDQLDLAYALTVHKAQGSEYPAVVLISHTSQYIMLQRNLLYTGLTRARKKCVFIGPRQAIFLAVKNSRPTRRYTRLRGAL